MRVLVIPANEEMMIVREMMAVLEKTKAVNGGACPSATEKTAGGA